MTTAETYTAHVQSCIDKAERGESKLTREALTVSAFSGHSIKRFLNNLCELKPLHYLEVGVHRGGTFCAAMFGNKPDSAFAVDDWSEFNHDGNLPAEFLRNRDLFCPNTRFLQRDCFTLTRADLPNPVNVFFYDGNHAEAAQYQALAHFLPLLTETFVFLVDDWRWEGPRLGTRRAIRDLGLKVDFEREMMPAHEGDANSWWNGMFIGVLSKP